MLATGLVVSRDCAVSLTFVSDCWLEQCFQHLWVLYRSNLSQIAGSNSIWPISTARFLVCATFASTRPAGSAKSTLIGDRVVPSTPFSHGFQGEMGIDWGLKGVKALLCQSLSYSSVGWERQPIAFRPFLYQ